MTHLNPVVKQSKNESKLHKYIEISLIAQHIPLSTVIKTDHMVSLEQFD